MTQAQPKEPTAHRSLDFALLLQRLETLLVQQSDPERAAKILADRNLWQRLPPEQALQWATLAEIAGLPELSLEVLAHLAAADPGCESARRRHGELLALLRPGADRAEALVVTAPTGPPDALIAAIATAPAAPAAAADAADAQSADAFAAADPEPVVAPFFELRRRERLLDLFLAVFAGREDCFARQWCDRAAGTQGYVPVRRALEPRDLIEHLQGGKTYGIYLLQKDSRVRTAVIDADLNKSWRGGPRTGAQLDLLRREKRYLLSRLTELARAQGLPCLLEFSGGKGFHFWFPAAAPVDAAVARRALQRLVKRIEPDLQCFNLEVFPKQDRLAGSGLGNLVKLPLGIHRATGKRSHFLHLQDRSPWAQLAILEQAPRLAPAAFERAAGPGGGEPAAVMVHPRLHEWAAAYPELALLTDRCPALGRIVQDCRQARELSVRDEKILLQTIGFLPRARTLLHHLHQGLPDYNAHLVDYRLSRLRGTPLGCKRIHSLLNLSLDLCRFDRSAPYPHPLLHWPEWQPTEGANRAERVVNLTDALERLRAAMTEVEHFLPPPQAG